ncbi:MAG: hypothetical protein H3C35_08760 [Bacteroidetes bacterium]|nr:hypothetical protein [Bacteroidota bacterium]
MKIRQLTYCLISLLVIAGASFSQKLKIVQPQENEVSMLTRQAVIINGAPGVKIILRANGIAVDTGVVRVDGIYDFLNIPVAAGPVTFTVASLSGFPETDSVKIHISGEPSSIELNLQSDKLFADGKSKIKVEGIVKDQFGVAIPGNYLISLTADTVQILAQDADPNQNGIQLKIENGKISFEIAAPSSAVISTISANWGSVKTKKELEFNTPIVPLMIIGSADASGMNLNKSGSLSGLRDEKKMDAGFHSDGRLAFYGRGTVWENYLLTASFDNERRQKDRLFKDLDPDVLYSIYGDNSKVDYTAQTSNPFFLKMERNRSYMMFGDFNTALTKSELARYDRTFTGINSHYEDRGTNADAFITVTDRKVVQDEIRGQGISGYYFLGSSNVVPGSEKVRIEIRDKRHNEVILSRAEKSRFGDYEIDYVQGTLFFKQPVAGIDQAGNPVYIVVSYESQGNAATNYVVGGQAEHQILNGWKAGVTAVTEERSPKNYTLLGLQTRYNYENYFNTSIELANGSDVNNSGNAWKIDMNGSPIERMQLKSYFRKVEAGFVNQTIGAGGAAELGSTKYGGGILYDGLWETKLSSDFYKTEQKSGNSNVFVTSITGGVERKISSRANLQLRVENLNYKNEHLDTNITEANQSTLITGKGTYRVTDRLNMTGEYEQSISSSTTTQVKPSSGTIGAEYRVLNNATVSVQQKFYVGAGGSTIFGLGSDLGYGTSMTAKYEIGNGINGQRNQASIGLKNVTKLTEDLTSNIQYERTRALDRNIAEIKTDDNDAFSLGLEFLPKKSYKASIKGELSKNSQAIRRVLTFGGDIRLANDFTAIDKFTYYEEARVQPQNASNTFADGSLSANQIGAGLTNGLMKKLNNAIGIAYRPVEYDWLNAIGKYEKKVEFNGVVNPQSSYNVNIVSLHTFIEPIAGLEIGTKYALKYASEEAFGLSASTITDLYLIRAEYDLHWNNFDVAAEYRILNSRIVDQANSNTIKNGYSAELGYVVMKNIHIGVGYNFVGTQDRDLVSRDYWSAGPFVSVRMKFTEKILEYFEK